MHSNGIGRLTARLGLEYLEARDVPAAPGDLDPTFGVGGVAQTSTPDGYGFGVDATTSDAAVDSAGRTLVLGADGTGLFVTRLTPGGAPDPTFGAGGTAVVRFPGPTPDSKTFIAATQVAADAAGRVVVLGHWTTWVGDPSDVETAPALARLTPDGAPDPTFGIGGQLILHPPPGQPAFRPDAFALGPDGGVVLVGTIGTAAVLRLTPGGRPDPAAGGGMPTLIPGLPEVAQTVAVDRSDRVLLVRSDLPQTRSQVVRLNPDLTADPTFRPPTLGADRPLGAVGTGSDGSVYLSAGRTVTKFTPTGAPDPGFGTGGTFTLPDGVGPLFQPGPLVVLPDGRVAVAGVLASPGLAPPQQPLVFVLTPAGALDATFAPAAPNPGVAEFNFDATSYGRLNGFAVTPVGDLVASGFSGASVGVAVARLVGPVPGRPDPTGNLAGDVVLPVPPRPFPGFGGAVRTASVYLPGGGTATAYATGPGTPFRVQVPGAAAFDPFGGDFAGGGFVAAADFDGDWTAEYVVTPDQGGSGRVVVVGRGAGGAPVVLASFWGIDDPGFRGGARVAVADVNHDGAPDLVVAAGAGGGPRVAVFDGRTLLSGTPTRLVADFFAFPGADAAALRDGVYVAAGDVDGDGSADLIFGGGPGGGPRVLVLSGAALTAGGPPGAFAAPVADFLVGGDRAGRDGVRVGVTNLDADGRADVVVGTGSVVKAYPGRAVAGTVEPVTAVDLDPHGEGAMALGLLPQ